MESRLKSKNLHLYVFIAFFALVVYMGLFFKIGPRPSRDYRFRYGPHAEQIINWAGGTEVFPSITLRSQVGYSVLIAIIFLFFGSENFTALIIFQVVISVCAFLLILRISLKNYYSKTVAVLFTMISISFFDNILWAMWVTPDSFFRAFLIFSYFILPILYYWRKFNMLLMLMTFLIGAMTLIRLETIVLFLPLIWFSRKAFNDMIMSHKILSACIFIGFISLAVLFIDKYADVFLTFKRFFIEGWIIGGSGQTILNVTEIEPYHFSQGHNIAYNVSRFFKLAAMRGFYFFNVFPPFWSVAHKMYYAVYMVFFYLLSVAGGIRVWKTKDDYFIIFILPYILLLVFQSVTFVDAEKRYIQSVLPFLIMFAGYGFDYMLKLYQTRDLTVMRESL